MNPQRLVGLYPATWRHRYGDEFLALLEERPPRAFDVLDIAWGALNAHLFPQRSEWKFWMLTRFTGLAALCAGLALLVGTLLVGTMVDMGGARFDVNAYTVPAFYVLAVFGSIGIHLRQTRARPNLAWPAFVAMLFGLVVGTSSVPLGMVGGGLPNSDFGLFQGIGLWVASAAMGAAVLVIGVIPRAVGLAFVIGALLAIMGPLAGDDPTRSETLTSLSRTGVLVYALGWIGAGIGLLISQPQEGVLGPSAT